MTTLDFGRIKRGTDGQVVLGQTLKAPLWKTISGDATLSAAGVLSLTHSYFTQRTITGTAEQISIANGDGVSGNPTISIGAIPAFSVHKNASDQASIAANTTTSVTWGTELFDVGSHFASDIWTPPAGKVFLTATIKATPVAGSFTAANFQTLILAKNGSAFKSTSLFYQANTNGGGITGTWMDVASGSDTYGIQVLFQITGGTVTISGATTDSYFMGHWISP